MLKWSYDLFYGCQPLTSPNTQLSWSARDKLSQIWLDAVLTSIRLQWESKASWLSIIRIAEEITNSRTALQIYDHSYNIWQKKKFTLLSIVMVSSCPLRWCLYRDCLLWKLKRSDNHYGSPCCLCCQIFYFTGQQKGFFFCFFLHFILWWLCSAKIFHFHKQDVVADFLN